MKRIEKYLPILFVPIAILGMCHISPNVISLILLIPVLLYLIISVNDLIKNSNLLSFITLYFISQGYLAFVLSLRNYAIEELFSYYNIVSVVVLALYFVFQNNDRKYKVYTRDQYLSKIRLLFFLALPSVWINA
jgi:hypothetical protein